MRNGGFSRCDSTWGFLKKALLKRPLPVFLSAVPRTARLSRSQRAVKPCRCVRRKGVLPNATAKVIVLSGSTVSTPWKKVVTAKEGEV